MTRFAMVRESAFALSALAAGGLAAGGSSAASDWRDVPAPSLRPRIVVSAPAAASADIPAETRRIATLLADKLNGGRLQPEDLKAAEDLVERHPRDEWLATLHEAVLLDIALQAASARRFDEALDYLQRAAALSSGRLVTLRATLAVLLEKGDWLEAEAVARDLAARDVENVDAWSGLAYALMRQGRGEEAREVLIEALATREDAALRAFLARIEQILKKERGMAAERLPHFTLRYDGERHEAIGRRIVEVLEDHYWTLAATFDHYPAGPIPVILLTRRHYLEATGAPTWSGGAYDEFDGHIRVPVEGLAPENVLVLEHALIHELTHVFVADIAGPTVPREIHEGLAQYMEGKRCRPAGASDGAQPTHAAHDDESIVHEKYRQALCWIELLMDYGGQSDMNAFLRRSAEQRDFRQAFLTTYGLDYEVAYRLWRDDVY